MSPEERQTVTKSTTITEALAELKVIQKRITSKAEFIQRHLLRRDEMRDPLERQGGSPLSIDRERQAITDLYEQQIAIRRAIAEVNAREQVSVDGQTRTIADWLVWKREVAESQERLLKIMVQLIDTQRRDAQRRDQRVVGAAVAMAGDSKPGDVIVNLDEQQLQTAIEQMDTIRGTLDGLLSLKNATLTVTY